MSTIRIEMLGDLRVRPESAVECKQSSKAHELLCYLLVHRDRPRNREQLSELLWPGGAPERTRKYLRQALWQLQHVRDDARPTTPRLVVTDGTWVRINPAAAVDLDLDRFEDAYTRCGVPGGAALDRESAATLGAAVQLYRGDLLEGWYQDWCRLERDRFRNMFQSMLDRLLAHSTACGEYQAGEAYGLRSLRYDPARERTHRALMELYLAAGEQGAALRQFRACHDALGTELGVRPSRETVALHERVRRASGDPERPEQAARLAPVSDLLDRLRDVRGALADIERQVTRDIRTIEVLLGRPAAPTHRPRPGAPAVAGPAGAHERSHR